MKNKKKAGVFLLLAVIILVAAVGIYYKTRPKEVTNLEPEFEEAQEKPQEEGSSGGTDTGIQIPGYTSVEVQAGTKDVSVELMNPEENQAMAEWFVKHHPFQPKPLAGALPKGCAGADEPEGCIQLLPGIHDTDGFFISCFTRKRDRSEE